jgi:hypothetical protein
MGVYRRVLSSRLRHGEGDSRCTSHEFSSYFRLVLFYTAIKPVLFMIGINPNLYLNYSLHIAH